MTNSPSEWHTEIARASGRPRTKNSRRTLSHLSMRVQTRKKNGIFVHVCMSLNIARYFFYIYTPILSETGWEAGLRFRHRLSSFLALYVHAGPVCFLRVCFYVARVCVCVCVSSVLHVVLKLLLRMKIAYEYLERSSEVILRWQVTGSSSEWWCLTTTYRY